MKTDRPAKSANETQVVVLTGDSGFAEQARTTFGASSQLALEVVNAKISEMNGQFNFSRATVAVIDLDATRGEEIAALERLMGRIGSRPPVVVIMPDFDPSVVRMLMQ